PLHLRFETTDIDPVRLPLAAKQGLPLAMHYVLLAVVRGTVNLIIELIIVPRKQGDGYLHTRSDLDRVGPDHVEQLKYSALAVRGALRGRGVLDRGPRHLQVRYRGHHFLLSGSVEDHEMIRQEPFVAGEGRVVSLLADVRDVTVQQGMQ